MRGITTAQLRALGIKLPASDPAAGFRAVRSARSSMRPGDSTSPRPRVDPACVLATIDVDVKAVNTLNRREHWAARARRAKEHRLRTLLTIRDDGEIPPLPVRVTMTRHYRGGVPCDGDGLAASLKHVRDGIADCYGIEDNDPRIVFAEPQQVRGNRWFVTVKIEHVADIDRREGAR